MLGFLDSNREERFFCAILLHVLLTPGESQEGVLGLINEKSGLRLIPSDLECYVEVAALRDAWRLLGDPGKWTAELYEARRGVLHKLLKTVCGYPGDLSDFDDVLRQHACVWSSNSMQKLVSPGRWPLDQLESGTTFGDPTQLRRLKWAFNSKPDLLLLSGQHGVLIEAKAASGFGKNAHSGYDQQAVQELIADLFPIVTRGLVTSPLRCITLTNKSADGSLRWKDIAGVVARGDIGDFAYDAMQRASDVWS